MVPLMAVATRDLAALWLVIEPAERTCPTCRGHGWVPVDTWVVGRNGRLRRASVTIGCARCAGSGRLFRDGTPAPPLRRKHMATRVTTKTATFVRPFRISRALGIADLYWLSEPLTSTRPDRNGESYHYVIVSTRECERDDGPAVETRVLGADADGSVCDWEPLVPPTIGPGTRIDGPQGVLCDLGYRIVGWGEVNA
jgi:hypothetical protein